MQTLTTAQRKFLRSQAHHLDPVVRIGKHGLTDEVVRATAQALDAHELIKIRFQDYKSEKRALVDDLARRTGSGLAGIIGHTAILFRQHPEEERRKIVLPADSN